MPNERKLTWNKEAFLSVLEIKQRTIGGGNF